MLVRLAGIEPTTPWFVAKYSIQLSYSRARTKLYMGSVGKESLSTRLFCKLASRGRYQISFRTSTALRFLDIRVRGLHLTFGKALH